MRLARTQATIRKDFKDQSYKPLAPEGGFAVVGELGKVEIVIFQVGFPAQVAVLMQRLREAKAEAMTGWKFFTVGKRRFERKAGAGVENAFPFSDGVQKM
jgi:hypothetical protein